MKLQGTDEESKIFDNIMYKLRDELDPEINACPFLTQMFDQITIKMEKFRTLYKQSKFDQKRLPELTQLLMNIYYLSFSDIFIHRKIQSIFKQIIKPSCEFKKIFDLYCMENSMQRSNALWEAVINFILLFENESIESIKNKLKSQKKNPNNKKLIFAELMKNHPRWRGYDKYSERMMKFSNKYPNPLKHEISVTLYYFIHGIQSSCIDSDLLTPFNLLTNFWPNLIAILEGREYSQTTDIVDSHPDSINNPG